MRALFGWPCGQSGKNSRNLMPGWQPVGVRLRRRQKKTDCPKWGQQRAWECFLLRRGMIWNNDAWLHDVRVQDVRNYEDIFKEVFKVNHNVRFGTITLMVKQSWNNFAGGRSQSSTQMFSIVIKTSTSFIFKHIYIQTSYKPILS